MSSGIHSPVGIAGEAVTHLVSIEGGGEVCNSAIREWKRTARQGNVSKSSPDMGPSSCLPITSSVSVNTSFRKIRCSPAGRMKARALFRCVWFSSDHEMVASNQNVLYETDCISKPGRKLLASSKPRVLSLARPGPRTSRRAFYGRRQEAFLAKLEC